MKKTLLIACIAVLILSFVIPAYYYGQMPEQIISHWNYYGDPNGYMGKFWGLFLLPVVAIGLFFLLLFLPKVDPLSKNIKLFEGWYHGFILVLMIFLAYLNILIILANLGRDFNMIYGFVPAFSLLIFYIGVLTENAKRNWMIGIRSPWTLKSDYVWEKTHRLGGILFKVSGVLSLFGVLLEKAVIWFIVLPFLTSALFLVIYSYFVYRDEKKKRKK